MSNYTVRITAYVNAEFADPDFNATTRTHMIALMEAVAALVDPTKSAEERIIDWTGEIEADPYFNQVPVQSTYYEQIQAACEYALNLAIGDNSPTGSGAKSIFFTFSQSGTNAPTFDAVPSPNNFGEVPTWNTYVIPGSFSFGFTTSQFVNPNKVQIAMGTTNLETNEKVGYAILDAKTIGVFSEVEAADPVTGAISGTATNGIFDGLWMSVTVFP